MNDDWRYDIDDQIIGCLRQCLRHRAASAPEEVMQWLGITDRATALLLASTGKVRILDVVWERDGRTRPS
jgi:hypothetical protein